MVTGKIDAIKQVRELNIKNPIAIEKDAVGRHYLSIGPSLKDAKDLVEAIMDYAVCEWQKTPHCILFDSNGMIQEIHKKYNG